jgi:predicted metalloprotease
LPEYRRAKLYIFTDRIGTRCGNASSAIGPFYCPGDENAYIDLTFYKALKDRFGAPGDFAQVYVLAHEIGHHVQKIRGAEQIVKRNNPRETDNQRSVRIELQADCYAGVWGHAARGRGKLEGGDLEEALTAAAAIGDDRLQKESGRPVNPESFSHGSSAQRVKWFRRGFDSGRIDACDSLQGDI